MMDKVIKDSTGAMVNLDAEEARVNELLGAFNEAILKRLPLHGGTLFHAAINLLREVIETYDDPNQMAKLAAESLVRQVAINTSPEEQAKLKETLIKQIIEHRRLN
jgi:hypothetical protein